MPDPPIVFEHDPKFPFVRNLNVYPGVYLFQRVLKWDLPAGNYNGLNIYRSYRTPFEGYVKINDIPIAVQTYTDNVILKAVNESPSNVRRAELYGKKLIMLKLSQTPKATHIFTPDPFQQVSVPTDYIDTPITDYESFYTQTQIRIYFGANNIEVLPFWINDRNEVAVIDEKVWNPESGVMEDFSFTDTPGDWDVKYYVYDTQLYQQLDKQAFYYKALLVDQNDNELGDLNAMKPVASMNFGDVDWLWKGALHRNMWLFWFGGEWCKIYLRKRVGPVCSCKTNPTAVCNSCYGTGIEGGFYGPYKVRMLVPETSTSVAKQIGWKSGMESTIYHMPMPILRSGDVVIRATGEILVCGEVTNVMQRGVILQQEFPLAAARGQKVLLPNFDTYDRYYRPPVPVGDVVKSGDPAEVELTYY